MSKVTKKQKTILEKVDPEMTYSMADALEILKSVKSNKFEESVDIAIRLGVDPNKSDQNVRGAVTLPNSLGKEVTVAVFADGDQAEAAKAAGAEHIGMDDLAEKFTKEEITVDVVISTNAAMKVVGKLGQVLGPKGLMPNPKTGTVSDDVATAINNVKAGQVRFRTDKNGIIQVSAHAQRMSSLLAADREFAFCTYHSVTARSATSSSPMRCTTSRDRSTSCVMPLDHSSPAGD